MATNGEHHTEDYQKLIEYGIDEKVSSELDVIYQSGLLSHGDLDERALDALKEFPSDGGIAVLKEFKESNLEHVGNKSAYLCGVMKTYRQKNRVQGASGGQGEKKPGPDEAKLKEILDRTGYQLDYTTGQRKYGGPPPDWDGPQPGAGHEVFCGKIPKEVFEDELIPLFEKCGKIWDLRLMMDPMSGLNRGYCFATFCDRDGAQEAVKQLENYEIKPGKRLKINVSVANVRLFVGNIPKSKSKEEIKEEFVKLSENLEDVIIYSSPDDSKKKNRGFAFLEYSTHKDASVAKRRIGNGRTRVWGCDIIVDWADPQEEPDTETMSKVKVLYVRNLKSDITEEQLKERFESYGKIERVKKIKDYGFVHFEDRDAALKAMEGLNGTRLGESEIQVSLAKPPTDNKKKENRMKSHRGGRFDDFGWMPPMGGRGGPSGRGGRGMRPQGRGGYYDFDFEYGGYGGYGDYRGGYADDHYYGDYYGGNGGGGYEDDFIYGGGYGAPRGGRGGARGMPPPPPRGNSSHGGLQGRGGMGRGARGGAAPVGRGGMRGTRGSGGGQQHRGGAAAMRGGGRGGRGGAANLRGDFTSSPPQQQYQPAQQQLQQHPAADDGSWKLQDHMTAAAAGMLPPQQHFPTVGEFTSFST